MEAAEVAILLAKAKGQKEVLIEGDCAEVIQALNNNEPDQPCPAFGNRESSHLVVFLITMAHSVISGVLEQLRSIHQTDQVNLLAGERKESEKLNVTLSLIQAVVEDAEEKQVKNGAVKAWLEQLTRISYDADDVLDDWKTEILSSQIQLLDDDDAHVSEKLWSCLFSLFSCFKSVVVRHDDSSKMIDINERLDRIVKDKALLDLNERRSREEPRPMTCLRVLDLCDSYFEELPDEVERLLHLRLLDLSNNGEMEKLPETVCNLFNLQTLKLNWCGSLKKLPKGIGKLRNLRHLELEGTFELSYFPWGLERLSFLRTLSKVVLDRDGGKGCQIGELKLLDHIQGELIIEGLGQMADSIDAVLKKKDKLRSLVLRFSEERQDADGEEEKRKRIESVLDGLQPHTNLAMLKIERYKGNRSPLWMSSINTYLPNLVKLELNWCNQCSELPALGRLQNLEHLELVGLGSVKRIGCEFYGLGSTDGTSTAGEDSVQSVVVFPKLHTLQICYMEQCEEWHLPFRRGVEIFPKLRTLTVHDLKLQMLPPGLGKLKSLEELNLGGLKLFQIDDNVTLSAQEVAVFPVLKKHTLSCLWEWEEQGDEIKLPIRRDEEGGEGFIMPCLQVLSIRGCPKLKVVPHYLFSPTLRSLKISSCPQLTGRQPCLPPLLEELDLDGDTGILSKSILPLLISGIGSPDHNENDYPNLHSFSIWWSEESSLPQGFNQLTAIQSLKFWSCEFLDFTPEYLKHLPMLQRLEIFGCPILEERCRKRESWTTNSHIPKIVLNLKDFIPE
ncbi:hypothetical protein IFM89_020737 [Coptis chinensis]|uniref:Rx N-terminal domain-containing protein n=1 Tax=Coptis chinensis TaxID=261450 RepID=A0A835M5P7_9MAGN|nr:hypothetical protein IFM89_020737 [Coptis chinensis]